MSEDCVSSKDELDIWYKRMVLWRKKIEDGSVTFNVREADFVAALMESAYQEGLADGKLIGAERRP